MVRIYVDGKFTRIDCRAELALFSGTHRLFFTSILGFEYIDGLGYGAVLSASSARLLSSVERYLLEQQVLVEKDTAISTLLDIRIAAGNALQSSRRSGQQIHQQELFEHPALPGFARRLKSYQIPAVAHMVAVAHAANFSVPGSGKTTMVLAAYSQLKAAGDVDRLLVVGPRSCFVPWEEEFVECFSRRPNVVRLTGSPSEREARHEEANEAGVDLVLVTYQTATNDAMAVADYLKSHKVMMVLDESHYIKRLSGGVWSRTLIDLAPFAAKRVILSGTPVPNDIRDIWAQMTFLWPEPPVLGTSQSFQDRTLRGGPDLAEEVSDELRPLFWRVKKSDVNLPPVEYHLASVPMRPYQERIYTALAAKILSDVEAVPSDREKLRLWRRAKMVRLLQAASNPSLLTEHSPEFRIPPLDGSGLSVAQLIERYSDFESPAKMDFAIQLAKKILLTGERVIVWSSFVHNLETLRVALFEFNPGVIHGAVPRDATEDVEVNRESIIERFKSEGGNRLLLANPGACAESISLHRVCKHAIYLDRSFNGGQYMQSLDRIHRLGMSEEDHVHYYLLMSAGSVDEVIHDRLEEKKSRLLALLEGDLEPLDLEQDDVSEPADEGLDFEAMVAQLRRQFSKVNGHD